MFSSPAFGETSVKLHSGDVFPIDLHSGDVFTPRCQVRFCKPYSVLGNKHTPVITEKRKYGKSAYLVVHHTIADKFHTHGDSICQVLAPHTSLSATFSSVYLKTAESGEKPKPRPKYHTSSYQMSALVHPLYSYTGEWTDERRGDCKIFLSSRWLELEGEDIDPDFAEYILVGCIPFQTAILAHSMHYLSTTTQ